MSFQQAERRQKKLRLALTGPAGCGKTFSALRLAYGLGERVFVIDSEHGSAALYADEEVDGRRWTFQHADLPCFTVEQYLDALHEAEKLGAEVVVIDSLSHAWDSCGGILEKVDLYASQRGADGREVGSFRAWGKVNPVYKKLLDGILASPCHVIVTLRTKTDYSVYRDDRGKTRIEKVGTKPIQKDGIDYEFDVVLDLDVSHNATVSKSRCRALALAEAFQNPGPEVAQMLKSWLYEGKTAEAGSGKPPVAVPGKETGPAESLLPEITEETAEGPDFSEISEEEMKKRVLQCIQNKVIDVGQLNRWKTTRGMGVRDALSGMDLLVLLGDIETYKRTGEFNPTPF